MDDNIVLLRLQDNIFNISNIFPSLFVPASPHWSDWGWPNINLQAGLNLQYSAVTTTNQPASSDQPESQSVWRWLLTANCTSLHLTSYNPALSPNHSGTKPVGTDHFSTSTVSSLSLGSSCWLLFSLTNLTEREKERGFGLKLLKSRNRKSLFRVIFNEHSHVYSYSYTCYPTQF